MYGAWSHTCTQCRFGRPGWLAGDANKLNRNSIWQHKIHRFGGILELASGKGSPIQKIFHRRAEIHSEHSCCNCEPIVLCFYAIPWYYLTYYNRINISHQAFIYFWMKASIFLSPNGEIACDTEANSIPEQKRTECSYDYEHIEYPGYIKTNN
jgi:hypothetical protein